MHYRWRGGPGIPVRPGRGVDGEELHPHSGYSIFSRRSPIFRGCFQRTMRAARKSIECEHFRPTDLALCTVRAYVFGHRSTEGTSMNKKLFKSVCVVAMVLTAFAAASYSQEKKETDSAHKIIHYGDLK
jgi:hypothetical protein